MKKREYERTRDICLTRAKGLLNKLKQQEEAGIVLFLDDEKNFVQVLKVNLKMFGGYVKSPQMF